MNRTITGLWVSQETHSERLQDFTAWGIHENLVWIQVSTLAEAIAFWQGKADEQTSQLVELIVIEQSTSDEFEPSSADEFLAEVQTCQTVVIYGPWCEGDGRTRNIWPPALRCPDAWAHMWVKQILKALRNSGLPLPWTASREEIIRWISPVTTTKSQNIRANWKVLSPDGIWQESISLLLTSSGEFDENLTPKEPSRDLWLVDADAWICQRTSRVPSSRSSDSFKLFASNLAGEDPAETTELVALTAWHDDSTRQLLIEQGAQRVVSKLALPFDAGMVVSQ